MRRRTKTTCSLKVRGYTLCLIDLNEYLPSYPWATLSDNIYVTELNEILLKSMHNIWAKQAYVQSFYCGYIFLKRDFNMF